ncbi:MAG: nucleotidyltransferase family protein [Alphaproteobacteria bacterium]|nr:nucleotidyltransferase family protein [Alphaproteobacteria bacterium]
MTNPPLPAKRYSKPQSAFILAAGKGTRMRPITDHTPKPMVTVAGKPLLGHLIEKLWAENVTHITLNTHHLPEVIDKYISSLNRPDIKISYEPVLLDTGGGVKQALKYIGDSYFYHINGDAFWTEGSEGSALSRLAERWNPENMDIILLLQPVSSMHVTPGVGDYDLLDNGQAVRSKTQTGAYMFTGVRITSGVIFNDMPDASFSFLTLMDAAEKKGRLYGMVHQGDWHHISTPDDLQAVNTHITLIGNI